MSTLWGDATDRVSHREVLLAHLVESSKFEILQYTAEKLRYSVSHFTAGRKVRQRLYYITYEEIVDDVRSDGGDDTPDDGSYGQVAA